MSDRGNLWNGNCSRRPYHAMSRTRSLRGPECIFHRKESIRDFRDLSSPGLLLSISSRTWFLSACPDGSAFGNKLHQWPVPAIECLCKYSLLVPLRNPLRFSLLYVAVILQAYRARNFSLDIYSCGATACCICNINDQRLHQRA